MRLSIIQLLLLLAVGPFVYADTLDVASPSLQKLNTPLAQSASESWQSEYIELLERTNQQISYWYNPYNTMIMLLTALITIGAIVATVLLYRQSKDFREQRDSLFTQLKEKQDQALKEYKQKHSVFWDELKEKNESIADELKKRAEAYEQEIEKTGSEAGQAKEDLKSLKSELDKSHEEWLKSKNFIEGAASASGSMVTVDSSLVYGSQAVHNCSKCGFGFLISIDPPFTITEKSYPKCPKCGNIDTRGY